MNAARAWALTLIVTACGGAVANQDGGSDGGGKDGTPDAAGWTACTSPDGYAICGGSSTCGAECPNCNKYWNTPPPPETLRICPNDVFDNANVGDTGYGYCFQCPDGRICVGEDGSSNAPRLMYCLGLNAGILYKSSGASGAVRYADNATFTGAELPSPSTCPQFPGIKLCGGACGKTCATGEVCTGRSPIHPYSLCLPDLRGQSPGICSDSKVGDCGGLDQCLLFKVDGPGQVFANQNGTCVSPSLCQAAAASFPGGAICN